MGCSLVASNIGSEHIEGLAGSGAIGPDSFLWPIGDFNGYCFSGVLFLFSAVLVIAVSRATPAPAEARVANLTLRSVSPEWKAGNRASWGLPDVLGSGAVLGLMLGIYLDFSFWLD